MALTHSHLYGRAEQTISTPIRMVYVRLNLSVNMYNMSSLTTTTTNQRMLRLNPVWESAILLTQPYMGVD